MGTRHSAIFEHGKLRLLDPLSLEEGTEVDVIVLPKTPRKNGKSPAEILAEIAALPMEPGGRESPGRDHDAVLYDKKPS